MTAASTIVPATKTVLVVDDTAFVRDRFATALTTAGHTAVTVGSVSELLARLRDAKAPVDLLVMDLRMPNSGGVELVRAVRKTEGGRTVPILVFSGTIGSADEVRDLSTLGVAGYVNEYSAVHHIVPALAPHLFPDNFNRRDSPRVVLAIPIYYQFSNTIATALTLNISKGGLGVRTMSPLTQGSKLRARFRLPAAKTDIDTESRVSWTDRRIGMGLQFEKVEPADQAAIDRFIDQHFFSNRKA